MLSHSKAYAKDFGALSGVEVIGSNCYVYGLIL